ncbi:MAG TPA: proline racemase family protein [Ktedonobacteraceae bacterium]|nr:proline racemase family protein [Ktedonobacteraceae bacterium]
MREIMRKGIVVDSWPGKERYIVQKVVVIDSHTAGEPTRVVLEGAPDLGFGSLVERLRVLRERFDWFRSAVVNEPHGSDALVGALLCEPDDPDCSAGVIFFNNVSYLGMCGHGTIGLVATLAHLGRIAQGTHRIQTPVGVVTVELLEDGRVTVHNVPSYRYAKGVRVEVTGYGSITGDIAWGGNWFFLVEDHQQDLRFKRIEALTEFSWRIREALTRSQLTGAGEAEIDHVELFVPGSNGANSKNFVLCPGKEYDRSPCGTGTSAKVACLAADGKLQPGEVWVQESIIGSRFEASYRLLDGQIWPSITGSAFLTLDGNLLLDDRDPFKWGICDEL